MPFVLLGIRRLRTIRTATIAGVAVLIGMWLERFMIVDSDFKLAVRLPATWGSYAPTWVEISISAATFAVMAPVLSALL